MSATGTVAEDIVHTFQDAPEQIVWPEHFTPQSLAAYRLGVRIGQPMQEMIRCLNPNTQVDPKAVAWGRERILRAYSRESELFTEREVKLLDAEVDEFKQNIHRLCEEGGDAQQLAEEFDRMRRAFGEVFHNPHDDWFRLGVLMTNVVEDFDSDHGQHDPLILDFTEGARFVWAERGKIMDILEDLGIELWHVFSGDPNPNQSFGSLEQLLIDHRHARPWAVLESCLKQMDKAFAAVGSEAVEDRGDVDWPPSDGGWGFRPGEAAFRGHAFRLTEKHWFLLQAFVNARRPLTKQDLLDKVWDGIASSSNIRGTISRLKDRLVEEFNLPKGAKPFSNVVRGENSVWEFDDGVLMPRGSHTS